MRHAAYLCSAAMFLLGGCANPVVKLDLPGYSTARSPAPPGEPRSMTEAMQKLNYLHAAYYEAVLNQSGNAQDTTTSLVWLGTAVAAMAASKVHRDVILGASLIGGTTLGLSRTQLDIRRIQIWTEGMKALDCVKEAALPLEIGATRRRLINEATRVLGQRRDLVGSTMLEVGKARADLGLSVSAEMGKGVDEALATASTALLEAEKSLVAATELLDSNGGGIVSSTVDRVHSRVTEAMENIMVDVGSVKQSVAGLGGFAAAFAPGLDVSGLLESGFARFKAAAAPAPGVAAQGSVAPDLEIAIGHLHDSVAGMDAARATLARMLGSVNLAAINTALKKCDVAGVATPLLLAPASLQFDEKTAATKGFTISGGTPPYTVSLLDAAPDGFAKLFDGGMEDQAQIKITSAVGAGRYNLRVVDSAAIKNSALLTVSVVAKSAEAPKPAPKAKPAPTKADLDKAWGDWLAALNKPYATTLKGEALSVVTAARAAGSGKLAVALNCANDKAALPIQDVRDRLGAAAAAAVAKLKAGKAIDADLAQIELSANGDCLKQ